MQKSHFEIIYAKFPFKCISEPKEWNELNSPDDVPKWNESEKEIVNQREAVEMRAKELRKKFLNIKQQRRAQWQLKSNHRRCPIQRRKRKRYKQSSLQFPLKCERKCVTFSSGSLFLLSRVRARCPCKQKHFSIYTIVVVSLGALDACCYTHTRTLTSSFQWFL